MHHEFVCADIIDVDAEISASGEYHRSNLSRFSMRPNYGRKVVMHLIFVDYAPFAYCYGVLAALLLWKRFVRDLEALWP